MQGNFSPFLPQPKLRTPNLAAVMTEEPQPKELTTWDVAVLPASMDAVLMVNRSCYSVPEKNFAFLSRQQHSRWRQLHGLWGPRAS